MAQSTIAMLIVLAAAVCFVTRIIPISITAVAASIAMAAFGIITWPVAFSGFANDVTVMVIGASIVGDAIFETGAAKILGDWVLKLCGNSERAFITACVIIGCITSAFTSNLAVVVMMMPIAAAAASSSNGLITKKNTYMAIGFAAMIGGGMTLVGSIPNVVGQAFLVNAGLEPMAFFDLTLLTFPRFIVFVLFYATIGISLQNKVFDFPEIPAPVMEAAESGEEKPLSPIKVWTPVVIMVLMIAGFISGIWTPGALAMIAGIACVVTGSISIHKVFEGMDWTTVWVLAGGLGFATGLSTSGAGELIATTVIGWFGGNLSFFKLLVVLYIVSVVLANLITASTVMTMLTPIALFICKEMGYDGKAMVMALIMILNTSGFINPVACAPVTVTLSGGYRFSDYAKMGSILTVVMGIATLVTFYFAYA